MPDESWVDYFRRMVTPRVPQAPSAPPINIPRSWQDIGSNLQKSGVTDLFTDPRGTLGNVARKWWESDPLSNVMQKASLGTDIAGRATKNLITNAKFGGVEDPMRSVGRAITDTDWNAPIEELTTPSTELVKGKVLDPVPTVEFAGMNIPTSPRDFLIDAVADPTNLIPAGPVLEGAQLAALPAWQLKKLKGLKQFAHGTPAEIPEASKMVKEGFDLTLPGADIDLLNRHMHSAGVTPAQYEKAIEEGKTPGVGTYAAEFGKRKVPVDFADPNAMVMNLTNPIPPEDVNAAISLLDPKLDAEKIRSIKARARKQYKYLPSREPEFPPETEAPKIAGLLPERAGWGDPKYPVPDYSVATSENEVARKAAVKKLEDALIQGNVYGRDNVTGVKSHSTLNNPNIGDLQVRDPKTGEYNPIAGIYYHDLGEHESLASIPSAMKAQDPKFWNPETEWQPFKEKAGQTFPIDKPFETPIGKPVDPVIPLGEEGKGGVMVGQPQAERYGQKIAAQKWKSLASPDRGFDPAYDVGSPKKQPQYLKNIAKEKAKQAAAKGQQLPGSQYTNEVHAKSIQDVLESHKINVNILKDVDISKHTPEELYNITTSALRSWGDDLADSAANEIDELWEMQLKPRIAEPEGFTSEDLLDEIDQMSGRAKPGEWGSTEPHPEMGKAPKLTQDIHLKDIHKILTKHGLDAEGITGLAADQNLSPANLHKDIADYLKAGSNQDERMAANEINALWQKKAAMQGLVEPPKPMSGQGFTDVNAPVKVDVFYYNNPSKTLGTFNSKEEAKEFIFNHPEGSGLDFDVYTEPKKAKAQPLRTPEEWNAKIAKEVEEKVGSVEAPPKPPRTGEDWDKWIDKDELKDLEAPGAPPKAPTKAGDSIKLGNKTYTLKDPDPNLTGIHDKHIYTSEGQDYIFKPTKHPYAQHQEATANEVAKLAGLPTPEMTVETIGGRTGTMQTVFGNKTDWPSLRTPGQKIENLSASELKDIIRNHPVDWLTANHDAHRGQWLVTPNGIIEVDRGQAFKHFGEDSLAKDYNPNAKFGEEPSIYIGIHKLWKEGKLPQLKEKDIQDAFMGTINKLKENEDLVLPKIAEALKRKGDLGENTGILRFMSLYGSMKAFWTK